MARDEPLDALLQRLNISPAPARAEPQGYRIGGGGGGLPATPPRPGGGSLLTTPLSRKTGGLVARPSPSLLDKYLSGAGGAASPAQGLGVGLGAPPPLGKPDPLAEYIAARTGSASGSGSISAGGTPLAGASARAGSGTPFAWDPLGQRPTSLPATLREDFSIRALRARPGPVADEGMSVSLRLSPVPATSRLGAGTRTAAATAASPAWQATPRGASGDPWYQQQQPQQQPPQQPVAQSSSDCWTEPSSSSLLEGVQALLQQREREAAEAAAQARATAERGWSTECSILQSKVSELQAQLRLKDIESQRTSSMAAELQRERDGLQEQVQQCKAELDSCQRQCRQAEAQRLEQQQTVEQLREALAAREAAHSGGAAALSWAQGELEAERGGAEALRQQVRHLEAAAKQSAQEAEHLRVLLRDADKSSASGTASLQQSLADLSAENHRLQRQYSLGQAERLAIQKKAEAASERCGLADARCQQLEAELHAAEHECLAKDGRLEEAQRQVAALQERAKALADQLAAASEQCEQAQRALREERQSSQQQRVHASASQQSEAALASQVKAMASQIQQLRTENAELQQRVVGTQSSLQDELAALEKQAAALQEENNELQAQLHRSTNEFEGKVRAMEDQRGLVKQLRAESAALQDALQQHEAEALQRSQQVAALQRHVDSLVAEGAQAQQALRESKGRVAELEALIAKSGMRCQASPLRDVVGSIRSELQEKDLQLMQAGEELAAERRHAQELQCQVLDQAVEIDELQRGQSEVFSLRQQLAAARQAEAQLKKRVGELSQLLAQQQQKQGRAGGSSGGSQAGDASPSGSTGSVGRPKAAPRALSMPPQRGSPTSSSHRGSPARSENRVGTAPHEPPPPPQQQQQQDEPGGLSRAEAEALRQELGRLRRERDRLAAEAEQREAEVMGLQGKVLMLQAQATDAENWLMAP